MGSFRAFSFLVLCALTCSSATQLWHELIPTDKEVIYKYHALVKAGTEKPHPFASTFLLEGKLHVQMDPSDVMLLRMSDLKYTMDNGKEGEHRETNMLPLPDHMKPLQTTFKLKLQESGKAVGLGVEEKEPEFIVNMKKAIGSMMQLDFEHIKLDSVKPHAFVSTEKTIFGTDKMLYNVFPHRTDELVIEKMHEMSTSHHLYQDMLMNYKPVHCSGFYEEPISHDSQKVYAIQRTSGHKILKTITSTGGVYLHPHQAHTIAMFVFVSQNLTFQEVLDTKSAMEMKSLRKYDDFETDFSDEPFEVIPDKQTLVPVVKQMLSEIVEYMQHNQINTKRPDFKQGQLINRIHKVMLHLDTTMLNDLLTTLKSKTEGKDEQMLRVFYDLLPLIGTKDTMTFIINIVKQKQVKETVAMEMLKLMSLHVRKPTEQMVSDMDVLLHLEDLSWPLQRTAILSFSNILNKLHFYKNQHFLDSFLINSDSHDITSPHTQHHNIKTTVIDVLKKYITEFINKIKTSQKHDEQLLYMEALHNMKTEQILKELAPAVMGEWFKDNDLRLMAMWAVTPIAMKHPEEAYVLFWPIFTDQTLPMEMRSTALFILMKAQPTLSRLINIYWTMQGERDYEFYGYYYSLLKALSQTTDPCSEQMKLFAKQLLVYTPMPYLHGLSGFFTMNYHDTKFNFGNRLDVQFINAPKTMILSLSLKSFNMNIYRNLDTVYIKVTGLAMPLLENFKLNFINNLKLFNYDELKKTIDDIPNMGNVQIEVTTLRDDQAIEFMYFDSSNMKSMVRDLSLYYEQHMSEKKNFLEIVYETYVQAYIPSDLGFPVLFSSLYPTVSFGSLDMSKEATNKITKVHIDSKWQMWKHGSFGLAFHNSFTQVWQGVNRYLSYDFVIPFTFDLALNLEQQTLTISSKRKYDGYAARSHVAVMVYVKDYIHNESLKKTSRNAQHWVVVTHPNAYKSEPISRDDYQIYDVDIAIADRPLDLGAVKYEWLTPLDFYIMKSLHKDRYLILQPDVIVRGLFKDDLGTDTDDLVDELMIRLNTKLNNEASLFSPAMKINSRITLTTKKENNPQSTLNVNALLDINAGHTHNNLKMQVTYITEGAKSIKMCLEGSEQYTDETITGYLDVGMSSTAEGKCTKDDRVMHVNFTGNELSKDKQFSANFDFCHKSIWSPIRGMKPYSCYAALSSVRNYEVKVKAKQIPENIKTLIMSTFEDMLHEMDVEETEKIGILGDKKLEDQEFEVLVKYPMNEDRFDVEIVGSDIRYKFNNIKRTMMNWYGIYPDNTQYTNLHKIMHVLGLNEVCMVDGKRITNIRHETKEAPMTDWVLIMGDSVQNNKFGIWMKAMDGKLALKLVHKEHILLVLPHKDKFTITFDGKTIEDHSYSQAWFHYDIMVDPVAFVYLSKRFGIHLVFNGDQMQIEIPKTNTGIVGLCNDK